MRFRITLEIDMPNDTDIDVFNELVRDIGARHTPLGGNVCYLATEIIARTDVLNWGSYVDPKLTSH